MHQSKKIYTKKYIKEKDNITYDLTNEIGYEENALDKIIYKDIIDNLDNINPTEKEQISFKLYYCDDLSIQEIPTTKISISLFINYNV